MEVYEFRSGQNYSKGLEKRIYRAKFKTIYNLKKKNRQMQNTTRVYCK